MTKSFLFVLFLLLSISTSSNLKRRLDTNDETSTSASAYKTIDGETGVTISEDLTTSESDTSILLLKNSATATVSDKVELSKTGGDSSVTENSEFYGINAGVLVTTGCSLTINAATITTAAKGSNAVFSTGTGAEIILSGTTITTTGTGSARGLDATYGGKITATGVTITTSGGSCATLATDRGEGTISCTDCTLTTDGAGSPIIYSTGTITLTNSKGTANGAQMVVIEGKNSATVTGSELTCTGAGNRDSNIDQCGIMIYQSMSGDAGEGTGTFSATGSKLTIEEDSKYYDSAPLFFITNTEAVINLSGNTLSYGSGIFISSKGVDEDENGWGESGSNGGTVTMTLTDQAVEGDIVFDSISTLTLYLKEGSSLKGTINGENTAKAINIVVDSTSSITLTGNSYITTLDNSGTIDYGDYSLDVSGSSETAYKNGGKYYVYSLYLLILSFLLF